MIGVSSYSDGSRLGLDGFEPKDDAIGLEVDPKPADRKGESAFSTPADPR